MASNINAKNTLYKLKTFRGMPYQNVGNIDYGPGNQYVDSLTLNNTFTQLEENDLYAAQYLKNKLKAQIGPSIVDPDTLQDSVEKLDNGTKFFINGNGSSIYWKKENSIGESLFQIDETYGISSVSVIKKVDDKNAVVSTNKGTFLMNADDINNPTPFVPTKTEVCVNGQDHAYLTSSSRGQYSSSLFAGKDQYGRCIFLLTTNIDDTKYFKRLTIDVDDDVVDMTYRSTDNRLVFATRNNVYTCKFDGTILSDQRNILGVNGISYPGYICSVVLLEDVAQEYLQYSNTILVFMSSGQILISRNTGSGNSFLNPRWKTISYDNVAVYDKLQFKNDTYCATTSGLMKFDSNGMLECVGCVYSGEDEGCEGDNCVFLDDDSGVDILSEVKHLTTYNGAIVYGNAAGNVLCSDGSYIYRYSGKCGLIDLSTAIDNIFFYNDVMFIASQSAIMYEHSDDFSCELKTLANLSCLDSRFWPVNDASKCIYATAKGNDESSYKAAAITINKPYIKETPEIRGLCSLVDIDDTLDDQWKFAYPQTMFTIDDRLDSAYAIVNYSSNVAGLMKLPLSVDVENDDYSQDIDQYPVCFRVFHLNTGKVIYDSYADGGLQNDLIRGAIVRNEYVYVIGQYYLYMFKIVDGEDGAKELKPQIQNPPLMSEVPQYDILDYAVVDEDDGYYAASVSGYVQHVDYNGNITLSNVFKLATLNLGYDGEYEWSATEVSSLETSCRSDILKLHDTYSVMELSSGSSELSDAQINTYEYQQCINNFDMSMDEAFGTIDASEYVSLSDLYDSKFFNFHQIIDNGEVKLNGLKAYYRSDLIIGNPKDYQFDAPVSTSADISVINSLIVANEEGKYCVKSTCLSAIQSNSSTNKLLFSQMSMPQNNQYAALMMNTGHTFNVTDQNLFNAYVCKDAALNLTYGRKYLTHDVNSFIIDKLSGFNDLQVQNIFEYLSSDILLIPNSSLPGDFILNDAQILHISDDIVERNENNEITATINYIDIIWSYSSYNDAPSSLGRNVERQLTSIWNADSYYVSDLFIGMNSNHNLDSYSTFKKASEILLTRYALSSNNVGNSILSAIDPENIININNYTPTIHSPNISKSKSLKFISSDTFVLSSYDLFSTKADMYQNFVHVNDCMTMFSYNNEIYRIQYITDEHNNTTISVDAQPCITFDGYPVIYSMNVINNINLEYDDDDEEEDNDESVDETYISWDEALLQYPLENAIQNTEYLKDNTIQYLQVLVAIDKNKFLNVTYQLSSNGDFYYDISEGQPIISANSIVSSFMTIDNVISVERFTPFANKKNRGYIIPYQNNINIFTTYVNRDFGYNERFYLNAFRHLQSHGSNALYTVRSGAVDLTDVTCSFNYQLPDIYPVKIDPVLSDLSANWFAYDKSLSSKLFIGNRNYNDDPDSLSVALIQQDSIGNVVKVCDNIAFKNSQICPTSCILSDEYYPNPVAFTYFNVDDNYTSVVLDYANIDGIGVEDYQSIVIEKLRNSSSIINLDILNTKLSEFSYPIMKFRSSSIDALDYMTQLCVVTSQRQFTGSGHPYGILSNDSMNAYAQISTTSNVHVKSFNSPYAQSDTFAGYKNAMYPDFAYRKSNGSQTSILLMANNGQFALTSTSGSFAQISLSDDSAQLLSNMAMSQMETFDNGLTYGIYASSNDEDATGSFIFKFNGVEDNAYAFVDIGVSLSTNDSPHTVIPISNNEYVVGAKHAIYECSFSDNGGVATPVAETDDEYTTLTKYDGPDGTVYMAAKDDSHVVSSYDMQLWNEMLSVDDGSYVKCLAQIDPYVVLAGAEDEYGDDGALYYSKHTISMIDDTSQFTAQSAYAVYDSLKTDIAESCEISMDKHIEDEHDPVDSSINVLNRYMDINFEIPDTFTLCANTPNEVSSDYIENMFVGDSSDGKIVAQSMNSVMGIGKWNQIDCNYIVKCWKSGITEFYIYLPTTYTYYIPHISGASYCTAGDANVEVNGNKNIRPTIVDNTTSVEVAILSSWFYMKDIFENTVKGNSLPLKVFKSGQDFYEFEGPAANLYHSFVQPSIASTIDTTITESEYYKARYYCFGSDAQAIKIVAYDPKKNYNKKSRTLILNGNGGVVTGTSLSTVNYILLEGDDPKTVSFDSFERDGGIFLGWTTNKSKSTPDEKYAQTFKISYDDLSAASTLNLFACWAMYQFGSDDTQITFNSDEKQTYTIAEVAIDPNADIGNGNAPIDNKLIVNFGDE